MLQRQYYIGKILEFFFLTKERHDPWSSTWASFHCLAGLLVLLRWSVNSVFLTMNQVVYLAIPKVFISLKPLFCFLSLIIASLTIFFILRVSVKSKQIQSSKFGITSRSFIYLIREQRSADNETACQSVVQFLLSHWKLRTVYKNDKPLESNLKFSAFITFRFVCLKSAVMFVDAQILMKLTAYM